MIAALLCLAVAFRLLQVNDTAAIVVALLALWFAATATHPARTP